MKLLRSKRGAGFIDVIVMVLLLGIIGIVFSATLPTSISCTRQTREYKIATAIAQRKLEQLRTMKYQSLTYPLMSGHAIDPEPASSPYRFTQIESVAGELPEGVGTLTITDLTSTLRKARVTVSWKSSNKNQSRSVALTTYFADRRPRAN